MLPNTDGFSLRAERDLSTTEVGRQCGVCAKTVWKWVNGGMLDGYTFGTGPRKRIRVRQVVLDAFKAEHGIPELETKDIRKYGWHHACWRKNHGSANR